MKKISIFATLKNLNTKHIETKQQPKQTDTMKIKEHDNSLPANMASEPAIAYQTMSSAKTTKSHSGNLITDPCFNNNGNALFDLEAKSTTPTPCRHSEEEVIQCVLKATADVDAGSDLISHEEFETQVASMPL